MEPQINSDKRRYAPQRTLRTQSIALTIFAVFAPSAVINEFEGEYHG